MGRLVRYHIVHVYYYIRIFQDPSLIKIWCMAKTCLAKVLKEKKMTKYRFAKLIGSEYSNIIRFFKPNYDPRLSTLEKWAKALKVSVKDLVED